MAAATCAASQSRPGRQSLGAAAWAVSSSLTAVRHPVASIMGGGHPGHEVRPARPETGRGRPSANRRSPAGSDSQEGSVLHPSPSSSKAGERGGRGAGKSTRPGHLARLLRAPYPPHRPPPSPRRPRKPTVASVQVRAARLTRQGGSCDVRVAHPPATTRWQVSNRSGRSRRR